MQVAAPVAACHHHLCQMHCKHANRLAVLSNEVAAAVKAKGANCSWVSLLTATQLHSGFAVQWGNMQLILTACSMWQCFCNTGPRSRTADKPLGTCSTRYSTIKPHTAPSCSLQPCARAWQGGHTAQGQEHDWTQAGGYRVLQSPSQGGVPP